MKHNLWSKEYRDGRAGCWQIHKPLSAAAGSSPFLFGLPGLLGVFAPGLLAMTAVLPFWSALRTSCYAQAVPQEINASVVGILLAALFRPIWTSTIHISGDLFIALSAVTLLTL